MTQLLVILLLPFELLQPLAGPQEMMLYVDQNPVAHIQLLPENDDAAVADAGVFRLRLEWISEPVADLASWFGEGGELMVERSRRRGAVYTLHPSGSAPELLDLTSFSRQIPADFNTRVGTRGESLVISAAASAEGHEDIEMHADFLPGSVLLRFPGTGFMLVLL
ncbi:hypothetical protein [Spirochaeta dissipatitropha]